MLVTPAIFAALRAAQQVAGVTIVYSRTAEASAELPAIVGMTRYQKIDGHGVTVKAQTRDYIVAAAELVLGGVAILPEAGDKIVEIVGSQQFIYEVIELDENAWRYLDPDRSHFRIHSQHVATEAAE